MRMKFPYPIDPRVARQVTDVTPVQRAILEEERIGQGFVMFERRPRSRHARLYKITAHLPVVERELSTVGWEITTYQTNSMMKAQENYAAMCRELATRSAAVALMGENDGP